MNFAYLGETIHFTKNKLMISVGIFLFFRFWYHTFPGVPIVCYFLGQLAFPLMCYLFVETLMETKDRKRFFLILTFLCILAEVPYDLVTFRAFVSMQGNNLLWGFLLAGVAIVTNQELLKYRERGKLASALSVMLIIGTIGIAMYVSYYCQPSFGIFGVLAPILMALFRKWQNISLSFPPVLFSILGGMVALFSIFYIIPVKLYNKKEGNQTVNKILWFLYPMTLGLTALAMIIMPK